jgi:hypothetical protein
MHSEEGDWMDKSSTTEPITKIMNLANSCDRGQFWGLNVKSFQMQEKKDNRIGGDMELGHVVMVLTTSMLGRCWAGIQWAAGKAEVVSCVSRLFFDGRRAV